jgi:hypothetical protein
LFISKEIRRQGRGGRIERRLIYVSQSIKKNVWAQPLVGRKVEPGSATASSI